MSRRGLAWLVLVVVVMVGLVGMRGLGESAVFGCHAPASHAAGSQHGPGVAVHVEPDVIEVETGPCPVSDGHCSPV